MAKRSTTEISDIVLRSNADGSKLRIGDVAEVIVLGVDRERAFFVGDNPAITVSVDRSAQGDAIDIQAQVQKTVDTLVETLPDGTKMELIRTGPSISQVGFQCSFKMPSLGLRWSLVCSFCFERENGLLGGRGIPTAICAAIALMYVAGITINMISLFALLITLGIVVDDAIVVGEHADYRARQGLDPVSAAETAARRMALPVFAATATTIIAFLGLSRLVADLEI